MKETKNDNEMINDLLVIQNINQKFKLIYIILWCTIFVISIVSDMFQNYRNFFPTIIFNSFILILALFGLHFVQILINFPKRFYYSAFGIFGLLFFIIIIGTIFFYSNVIAIGLFLNISILLIIISFFLQKVYSYFVDKYELTKLKYLLIFCCPYCQKINYLTINSEKDPLRNKYHCFKCKKDFSTEFAKFVGKNFIE